MVSRTYPIEIYCLSTRRFRRARWKACWENWPDRPFRIIGPAEVREGGGTAGHVARGAPGKAWL